MAPKRTLGPILVVFAVAVAACGTSTGSGSTTSSAPSSAPSVAASAAASAAAPSAAASAEASAAASPAAGGGDLASKIPTTVGDVTLSATVVDGDSYIKTNVNQQLAPILTLLGKTPTDVTVATATGSGDKGTLFISAVQVPGADVSKVQDTFQTAAAATKTNVLKTADMGGKSVVQVTTPSYTLAVWANGDTIWYVQSPDADLVTQAVTALPS